MGTLMQERTAIYGLIDPRTNELRYVGKTNGSLHTRRLGHINDVKRGRVSVPRHRWIAGLLAVGIEPDIFEIEIIDRDWQEAERFWIAYFRAIGADLLNATAGGDGISAYRHRPDTRERQRAAALRRYADEAERRKTGEAVARAFERPEAKANMMVAAAKRNHPYPQALVEFQRSEIGRERTSKRHEGKRMPDDVKEKLRQSALGRKRSEESRLKQAATRRGKKHSPETIAKMRETWARKRP